jgi:hypothetical protein
MPFYFFGYLPNRSLGMSHFIRNEVHYMIRSVYYMGSNAANHFTRLPEKILFFGLLDF